MKSFHLFLVSGLTLVAASALACPSEPHLVCNNMAGDGGYAVTFSPDGLAAKVSANSIAGARTVANVTCPKTEPAPCCDRLTTTVCVDDSVRSGNNLGYTATLETGGIAGISQVTLKHGETEVAVIKCKLSEKKNK